MEQNPSKVAFWAAKKGGEGLAGQILSPNRPLFCLKNGLAGRPVKTEKNWVLPRWLLEGVLHGPGRIFPFDVRFCMDLSAFSLAKWRFCKDPLWNGIAKNGF